MLPLLWIAMYGSRTQLALAIDRMTSRHHLATRERAADLVQSQLEAYAHDFRLAGLPALAARGIRMSRPLGFRNNYALGMRKDVAAAVMLQALVIDSVGTPAASISRAISPTD